MATSKSCCSGLTHESAPPEATPHPLRPHFLFSRCYPGSQSFVPSSPNVSPSGAHLSWGHECWLTSSCSAQTTAGIVCLSTGGAGSAQPIPACFHGWRGGFAPRAPRNHGGEWPCTSQRRLQCLTKTPKLHCSLSQVLGRNVSSLQMIRIFSLSLLKLKLKHAVKGKGSVSTLN